MMRRKEHGTMHLRRYFFGGYFFGIAFARNGYVKDAWKDKPILFIYFSGA
jgi:hypothetical protein